jgi:hypothetical protein
MNGLLNVSAGITKAKDKPWPHLPFLLSYTSWVNYASKKKG